MANSLVKRFTRPIREAGALNSLYAPVRFLDDHAFLTKAGSVGVVFSLEGIDYECLSDDVLETVTHRLAVAYRALDEDIRIYQYMVKQDNAPLESSDQKRVQFLKNKGIYSIRLFLVLLYETKTTAPTFKIKRTLQVYANKLKQQAGYLRIKANSFQNSVDDLLHLTLLGKTDTFAFFRLLANPDPTLAQAETISYDNHLDYWMTSGVLACTRDGVKIDREHLDVLVLRKPPKQTFPVLLRGFLSLPSNFILCSEFKREPNETTVGEVDKAEQHFHHLQTLKNLPSLVMLALSKGNKQDIVPDESAIEAVKELKQTVVRINTHGEYMGRYTLTLVLHSHDKAKLQAASAEASRIVGNQEGSFIRETYNALNSYLSIAPGNTQFNLRQIWMLSQNYADLSLVFAPYLGNRINPHLKQEHLLLLESRDHTPVAFNLHEGDLLGFLLLGIMGSGKSFTMNLFADASQKYKPFTYILDVGGSYKYVVQKHGGSFIQLSLSSNRFTINPFAIEKTPENIQFLYSFVRVLLTNSGLSMTPKDDRELYEEVQGARRLGDLKLSEHLMDRLYPWTGTHQYGPLFDNEEDTLSLSEFQCFDFQGMETYPQVVEPLIFYLFERISQVVYDPKHLMRFKQLLIDEAWTFITNPTAKARIKKAGLTWRKHNGGIGFVSQFIESLEEAGMLDMMNALCPTKILLANPGADLDKYARIFKLNPNEKLLFSQLRPKGQIMVKTPTRCQILEVNVDPESVIIYGNDPYGNERRNKMIAEFGEEEGIRRLAAG